MKKTPLYENHIKLGGRMIDFGGWMLPVQYEGIMKEHNGVRTAAGLFDVSHMGEITVKGAGAEAFIQNLVTNDISRLEDLQAIYSPMCYPDGGTVDDVIVYKFSRENYLIVVNAANTDKDFEWMARNKAGRAEIENVSERYAQLALQGPAAQRILQNLTGFDLGSIKFFRFAADVKVKGIKALVSRSGYTGEDGFELYIKAENAGALWESLLDNGREEGLIPVGLGARDTLRFEASLPLYGQELAKDISPLEAGLSHFVKLDKEFFIGGEALKAQAAGLKRKLVGFEMIGPGVARHGFTVLSGGKEIGFVTSGSYSPTLDKNLGMALVSAEYSGEGAEIDIAVRNKIVKARTVKMPFYTKKYIK